MAYEEALVGVSLNAGADLSAAAKMFTAVKVDSNGNVISASTAGEAVIGIIQNTGKLGDPIKVGIGGISKAKTAGAITAGGYVSTNASGLFIAATTGHKVVGTALVTAASGDVIPVLLAPPGTGVA